MVGTGLQQLIPTAAERSAASRQQKPETATAKEAWIPALAGMTDWGEPLRGYKTGKSNSKSNDGDKADDEADGEADNEADAVAFKPSFPLMRATHARRASPKAQVNPSFRQDAHVTQESH